MTDKGPPHCGPSSYLTKRLTDRFIVALVGRPSGRLQLRPDVRVLTVHRLRVGAHWRKAPAALVHHRSVVLAVFVAALLAALASSSSPFVTTAAASEALKN